MLWGGRTTARLSGEGVEDGSEHSGWLGVDAQLGDDGIAGLAVSRSSGAFDWRSRETVRSTVTELRSLWTYSKAKLPGGGSLRSVYGAGRGMIRLDSLGSDPVPLEMMLVGVGVVHPLASIGDRLDLYSASLLGDLSAIRLRTLDRDEIEDQSAGLWRVRGGVELQRTKPTRRSLRVLARHGGTQDRSGSDIEVDGRLRLTPKDDPLALDLHLRWMVIRSGIDIMDAGGLWEDLGPRLDAVGTSSVLMRAAWDRDSGRWRVTPYAELEAGSSMQRYAVGLDLAQDMLRMRFGTDYREGELDGIGVGLDVSMRF